MALSTYTELKASIADWLVKDDLTAVIPDFITLTEARLRRMLRGKDMRVRAAFSITAAAVDLPSGTKEVVSLTLNDDNRTAEIGVTSLERVMLARQGGATGIPRFVAIVAGQALFGPPPDTTYTAEIVYDAELTALSGANPSNWCLTSYPDIYLYGSLAESAPYLRDDERIPTWDGRFQQALSELELARDRAEFGPNTPIQRPKSALGE